MPETVFPISDSVIAVLQSAAVLPARSTDAFSPSVMAAVTCVEQQYSLEHSMLMRCVGSLRNAWLAMGGTLHSCDQLPSAADHTHAAADADSDSPSDSPDVVGGSVSRSERVQELESQIRSLKAHIQDLEAQLAATSSSLSQSSLHVADVQSLNDQSIIAASGGQDAEATVLKCSAAVSRGIRRSDPKFLRETFDRHKDGTGSLCASNLTAALTEADAPVIPDCDAAAAAAIARFDGNSNGVMEFGEFERAVSLPDELQLYFQEKQQPALADALRVLVGRGSDQLLAVSRLPASDVRAASAAVCASVAEQAAWLHEELQRLFTAQFEIQAQMEADAGKFNVVKMACGGVEDFHSGLTGRVGMPHLKFKDAMRQEHCERAGCNTQFTTGNYKITTTPRKEWLYIAGDEAGQQEACADMDHGRRIVRISELMKLKLAIDAQLTEVEMLAIVLYTGPMFQVSQLFVCALACCLRIHHHFRAGVQLHFAALSCRQVRAIRAGRQPLRDHHFRARVCRPEGVEMHSHARGHTALPRVGRADRSAGQVSPSGRARTQRIFRLGNDEHFQRARRGSRLQRGETAAAEGDGDGD